MKKASAGARSNPDHTPDRAHHSELSYRIGDLLWCQEARNNKLWWPAMVTYDPNQGIFFRIIKQKVLQYHVQYFGISAIRGWVTGKSCVAFNDISDKEFDLRALPKKTKAEYEVAIQEVGEAKLLDHKQRKLKFIFSFGPPQNDKKNSPLDERKNKKDQIKKEPLETPIECEKESKPLDSSSHSRSSKRPSLPAQGSSPDIPPANVKCHTPASQSSPALVKSKNLSTPMASKAEQRKETSGKRQSAAKHSTVHSPSGKGSAKKRSSKRSSMVKSCEVVPPPTFHDLHSSNKPLRRKRSSSSSSQFDCDECMEYICTADCEEMVCTSQPESFQPPDLESLSKPIIMFVQKEYEETQCSKPAVASTPGKLATLPSQVAPLTKGSPTMNTVTEMHSPTAEMHSPTAEVEASANQGRHPEEQCLAMSTPANLSSSGSCLDPGSKLELGRNGLPAATAGVKRKRKGSVKDSHSVGATPSNLLVAQTMSPNGIEETEPSSRLSSHRTSSLTSLLEGKVETCGNNPAASVSGRNPRRRNSEQGAESGSLLSRKSLRLQSVSAGTSNGSLLESTGADSGSEASSTPMVLTPGASSPAESSSLEVDATASDTAASVSSGSSRAVKRRSKANPSSSDITSTCWICDCEDLDLLTCSGYCFHSFHLDCLGLIERPSFEFVCDECVFSSGSCFACGKAEGQVYKCSKSKCSKLYHLECIRDSKLFQFTGKGTSFVCALHVCARCTCIGGQSSSSNKNLLQCVKCPLALHQPDCLVAGCEILDHTHMACYQHVKIVDNATLYRHTNLNTCLECGDIGSLYCCDMCSAAYHLQCLDEDARPQGENSSWKCPSCAVHDLPTYSSLVVTKFGRWRWWPSEVVSPEEIPNNILSKKPGECMFVVRFCGSREYCWTYHGRVIPYTEDSDSVDGARKRVKTMDKYQQACEEASELFKVKCQEQEERQAKVKLNSKFYHKIKTNKYLVPRPPPNPDELDFHPCQCTPENPCREESTCVNRASHIECTPKSCPVGDLCQNHRMQKFLNAKTETFYTGNRGWGLKASSNLTKGDFVIEYVGEILDEDMCRERIMKCHSENIDNFYMLTLDAGLVIDAGRKSNHARFINHSCSPNCETQKWHVRGEPRIGIFVSHDIEAGTELTFDYQLDSLGNEKKECHCGSKNCSGFLGERKMKVATSEDEKKIKVKAKKKKPKPKPRRPVKEEESVDEHDDACFICRDGGELLLCDHKACPRAYHLACLSRKLVPAKSQKWQCPWHFCSKCQKPSVTACSMCPESYCNKHAADKLYKPSSVKFETEEGKADTFDDDGVTVSVQNMLLCEDCLQDSMQKESATSFEKINQEEIKDEETVLEVKQLGDDAKNKPCSPRNHSPSKCSTNDEKVEQKSKLKKPCKGKSSLVAKSDSSASNSVDVTNRTKQDDDQPLKEHEQQALLPPAPAAVQQQRPAQNSAKKKKKAKEPGKHHATPPFSPPPDLQRPPLASCRELLATPTSSGSIAPVAAAAPQHRASIPQGIVVNNRSLTVPEASTLSVAPRVASPEPNVDVVYTPLSRPPIGGDQQEQAQRSGLEELLQQNNAMPSQQLQQQQDQARLNVYLPRSPVSQMAPNGATATRPGTSGGGGSGGGDANSNLGKAIAPPIFHPAHGNISNQVSSPAIAGGTPGYPNPGGFMGAATAGLMRSPAGFQQPQQPQPFWLMPNRNGLVNGLDPSSGGFSYSPYQPAFIAPHPLGLTYPYFPDASMPSFDAFSGNVGGAHHQQMPPSSSALPPSSSVPPTSSVFPTVLPSGPQNFFQWK